MKPSDIFFTPKDAYLLAKKLRMIEFVLLLVGIIILVACVKLFGLQLKYAVYSLTLYVSLVLRVKAKNLFLLSMSCLILVMVIAMFFTDQYTVQTGGGVTQAIAVWAVVLLLVSGIMLVVSIIANSNKIYDKKFVHPVYGINRREQMGSKAVKQQDYLDAMHAEHILEVGKTKKYDESHQKASNLVNVMSIPNKSKVLSHGQHNNAEKQNEKFKNKKNVSMDIIPAPTSKKATNQTADAAKMPKNKRNLIRW